MFQVPGVCNGNPETTVWCHSNKSTDGKGAMLKAHDCFGAFGCYACHTWYDQGKTNRATKDAQFELAFRRTVLYCWLNGLFAVAA